MILGEIVMRKNRVKILNIIATFFCVFIMLGGVSVAVRAEAKLKAPTEVKFVKNKIHYKASFDGYYTSLVTYKKSGGKECLLSGVYNKELKANEVYEEVDYRLLKRYNYSGTIKLYVFASKNYESQNYCDTLEDYQKRTDAVVASKTYTLSGSDKMKAPSNLKVKVVDYYGIKYEISWDNKDEKSMAMFVGSPNTTMVTIGQMNCTHVDARSKETEIVLRRLTDDLTTKINSDLVIVVGPAVDLPPKEEPKDPVPKPAPKPAPKDDEKKEPDKPQNPSATSTGADSSPATTQKAENVDSKLKVPAIKKVSAGKKQMKITWKKVAKGLNGYEVQYSTDKSFGKKVKTITIKKTSTTSKVVKKLKKGKYYVRIRGYKNSGSGKLYTDWSKPKSVRVKS